MTTAVLILAGALAIGSALGVVTIPNAVYSALCLLLNLLSLSVLFLLLNAQFMFAAQLVIYAGAILVLFLFVVTLLSPDGDPIFSSRRRLQTGAGITLGLLFGIALFVGLTFFVGNKGGVGITITPAPAANADPTQVYGTVEYFGAALFTRFLLPFEVTSLLLLVALIGAVIFGKRKDAVPPPLGNEHRSFVTPFALQHDPTHTLTGVTTGAADSGGDARPLTARFQEDPATDRISGTSHDRS